MQCDNDYLNVKYISFRWKIPVQQLKLPSRYDFNLFLSKTDNSDVSKIDEIYLSQK
jgi:hypothetical protein